MVNRLRNFFVLILLFLMSVCIEYLFFLLWICLWVEKFVIMLKFFFLWKIFLKIGLVKFKVYVWYFVGIYMLYVECRLCVSFVNLFLFRFIIISLEGLNGKIVLMKEELMELVFFMMYIFLFFIFVWSVFLLVLIFVVNIFVGW